MEIVPFDPSDLVHIHPPMLTPAQWRAVAPGYRDAGPAYTLVDGDTVLGCGGVLIEGRVGTAWAVLSDALRVRPIVLHRKVKRLLDQIVKEYRLGQIFAVVYEEFSVGRRWLERLGFREEGTLTDYLGTGLTYRRYVLARRSPRLPKQCGRQGRLRWVRWAK